MSKDSVFKGDLIRVGADGKVRRLHSPGPWRWGKADEEGEYMLDSLHAADGPMGFYDEGPDSCGKSEENRANRALISEAPAMAELLREFAGEAPYDGMPVQGDINDVLRRSRAHALLKRLEGKP